MNHEEIGLDKQTSALEKEATIEAQTEQVEREIEANMALLNENVARLPEPEAVSVDEHPGLREKLEKYKQDILEYRDNFVTKIGLTMTAMSPIAGIAFSADAARWGNGVEVMTIVATIGLLAAAVDKTAGRINAYLETREYKKAILAGETI